MKTYSVLLYSNRHLIIENKADSNPRVLCECYLEETAELIRELLTEYETKKEEIKK